MGTNKLISENTVNDYVNGYFICAYYTNKAVVEYNTLSNMSGFHGIGPKEYDKNWSIRKNTAVTGMSTMGAIWFGAARDLTETYLSENIDISFNNLKDADRVLDLGYLSAASGGRRGFGPVWSYRNTYQGNVYVRFYVGSPAIYMNQDVRIGSIIYEDSTATITQTNMLTDAGSVTSLGLLQGAYRTTYLGTRGWEISDTPGDTDPPYAIQWSPEKDSTGVLISNRTITFHIQDAVDVLTANGVVNIEGTDYTCSSGVTCTGGGTTDLTVSYTKGSDWGYSQTVNVSTSGFRDTAGNVMLTDTWSYTTEAETPNPPDITTTSPLTTRTQGTPFTQTFSATGGTSPYTWSVISGSIPTGTALSSAGVFSGTPSVSGPFNFTVKIVDALAAEDNQALSIIINPAAPGGQTTVNVATIQDTYINGGEGNTTTNYSDNTYVKIYQWPAYSVINRVLDNVSFTLPDNVSIQAARLYMYVQSYSGSGGTNPMQVYAYRSDPITPSTATWGNSSDITMQTYESVAEVPLTGWVSWDVKNMVAWAYANGSPLYIALDGGIYGASDTNRTFTSVDGAEGYRPFVSITYMQLVAPEGPSISSPGKMRVTKMRGSFR